ncbi:hypothetical protein U1Q18_051148 [Sarracenia purpurea var. burkii]
MQSKRQSSRLSDTIGQPRTLKELRSLGSRSTSRGKSTASLLLGHKMTPAVREHRSSTIKSCPSSRSTSKTRRVSGFALDNPNLQWQSRKKKNTPVKSDPPDHHRKDLPAADDADDQEEDQQDHHSRRKSVQLTKQPLPTQKADVDGQEGDKDDDQLEDGVKAVGEEGDGDEMREKKHIHPCVCDIDKRRWGVITQIEEEYRLAEEAELERRRQAEEEMELYGDEYDQSGAHPKRKKRSARRASMVSLGVKQIINWRKSPKIKVKFNKTSALRRENPTYCGKSYHNSPVRTAVNWHEQPKVEKDRTGYLSPAMRTELQYG